MNPQTENSPSSDINKPSHARCIKRRQVTVGFLCLFFLCLTLKGCFSRPDSDGHADYWGMSRRMWLSGWYSLTGQIPLVCPFREDDEHLVYHYRLYLYDKGLSLNKGCWITEDGDELDIFYLKDRRGKCILSLMNDDDEVRDLYNRTQWYYLSHGDTFRLDWLRVLSWLSWGFTVFLLPAVCMIVLLIKLYESKTSTQTEKS